MERPGYHGKNHHGKDCGRHKRAMKHGGDRPRARRDDYGSLGGGRTSLSGEGDFGGHGDFGMGGGDFGTDRGSSREMRDAAMTGLGAAAGTAVLLGVGEGLGLF
jgi:hypothetical protein